MDHCEKSGASKRLKQYSLPLTGAKVVDLLITDLGVFEFDRKAAVRLLQPAPGVTVDEILAKSEAEIIVS